MWQPCFCISPDSSTAGSHMMPCWTFLAERFLNCSVLKEIKGKNACFLSHVKMRCHQQMATYLRHYTSLTDLSTFKLALFMGSYMNQTEVGFLTETGETKDFSYKP